jgi:hypothetical protein
MAPTPSPQSRPLLRFSDKQWLPEDEAGATIKVDFRVRSQPPFFYYLFLLIIVDVGMLLYVRYTNWSFRRSGTEGEGKYMGAFAVLSSSRPTGLTLRSFSWYYIFVGHCRPRTFPDHHRIVLPRSAERHTRYEYSPHYVSPFRSSHRGHLCPRLLHMCMHSRTCVICT